MSRFLTELAFCLIPKLCLGMSLVGAKTFKVFKTLQVWFVKL